MNSINAKHYLLEAGIKWDKILDPNQFPFSLPSIKNLGTINFNPAVTFIIGENGMGKSTILEAIAVALGFNPEGGTKNFAFNTRASHSCLHEYLRLAKAIRRPKDSFFLRAESYFNVATEIENLDASPWGGPPIINSYGKKSLHEQSHGESFFSLFMHRFGGQGLYILDEPEAALSPMKQLAFLSRLHELVENDSQFIIATHSPIIMAYPNSEIIELTNNGLNATKYTDTEHYKTTKYFIDRHETMLQELMK